MTIYFFKIFGRFDVKPSLTEKKDYVLLNIYNFEEAAGMDSTSPHIHLHCSWQAEYNAHH